MINFDCTPNTELLKSGCVLYVTDKALRLDHTNPNITMEAYIDLLSALGKKALILEKKDVPDDLRVLGKPLYVKDNVIVKILDISEIKDYV